MNLEEFFAQTDLAKTPEHQGTYFEQKTTPDLLWAVAQVVLEVTKNDRTLVFSDKDVRSSPLFNSLMSEYFSKPEQDEDTENEYNKVSSYQLGLLAFAGVLREVDSRPKKYQIDKLDALEHVALNDFSALKFLSKYVEKFIADNGLSSAFKHYKDDPSQENYNLIKDAFWEWARTHTKVRGTDRRHSYRVLNKIFNIYAHSNGISGEYKARVVAGVCPYGFLVYNRPNFRDEEKPTDISRQVYEQQIKETINSEGVLRALTGKAKEATALRFPESEVKDKNLGFEERVGIHIHHILPESPYPQFSFFRENLISLTPGQHLSRAHPNGNTQRVDPKFQLLCLLIKLDDVQASLLASDGFYKLANFVQMVNTKFNLALPGDCSIELVGKKLNELLSALE